MNYETLCAQQALKIAELESKVAEQKDRIDGARRELICIGGPLNDNYLGYTKEQLFVFHRIYDWLDA